MGFLKKIFTPSILILSLLILSYGIYQSEVTWSGARREYYNYYYVVSFLLIFFSIFTYFISQEIKEYLIILSISLIIALYLFEGFLTFQKQALKEQLLKENIYEKEMGEKWEKRSKFEIYNDLKKSDDEIVVVLGPRNHIFKNYPIFPLSGISNSKTIYCNEHGYYSIYQSDRHGFNNPNFEWDQKEIEYLLVGDSFTHGACVNRPHDISSVLRTITNKSVLNLGYGSDGPLLEYATLREYLNKNVKKIIWVYTERSDLNDLLKEKEDNILINYLNDMNYTQNLKHRQDEINELAMKIIKEEGKKDDKEVSNFNFKKFLRLYKTRNKIFSKILVPAPVPEFKKIIQLTKNLVEKNESELFFVYLPTYSHYQDDFDITNYNLVKGIVNDLGIKLIDMHEEVFKKEENPLKLFPFEQSAHYTIEGYKKVAETIYKHTKD